MKIPFLRPVIPRHVFALAAEGVTYANVRRDAPAGFAEVRAFAYPAGSLPGGPSGTPLFTREAIAEAVTAARRLADDRLSRGSVVFPDAWARILPIDFDSLPDGEEAAAEMVRWKLKKLLPGVTSELAVTFREMAPAGSGRRVLVAAAPAESLASIEKSFESLGVRIGQLLPASLALFQGVAPALAAKSSGDFAFVHRATSSFTLLIARGAAPLFFRQRPIDADDGEHAQELRLSLSYYTEKLGGPGLSAVYLHDELAGTPFAEAAMLPVPPIPLTGRLFGADAGFDERIAAHPELLASFAAVWDNGAA